jgi:deoxyadenosine/deoxycytidine kinase
MISAQDVPIIWVEGIIASGKTTLAKQIAKRLEFKLLEEPVESNPYLAEFYKDPKKYAFGLQIYMLHHRFAMKQESSYVAARRAAKGVVLDRCIAGDRAFAHHHMKVGNIDPLDYQCYEFCYQMMARTILPPTVMIYLNVQAETAFERMKRRNRAEEAEVSLQYLKDLKAEYELLLSDIRRGLVPWGHGVHVYEFLGDVDTATEEQWEHTCATVKDICNR